MSTYTEDHLVEQPAIQLMQHELGWDVGGNIEHRTSNIERRSEAKRKMRTNPALQRLNPDLPVEAIEGALEERLGARRSGNGLRRDATATFCWPAHSIFTLQDSGFPRIWNP